MKNEKGKKNNMRTRLIAVLLAAVVAISGLIYPCRGCNKNQDDETATTTIEPDYETKIIIYTVKSGDTLEAIAEKYETTIDEILKNNDGTMEPFYIKDPHYIFPDQQIRVPSHIKKTNNPPEDETSDSTNDMGLIKGIDISEFQDNIDWDKLEEAYKRNEISFIILRICENITPDQERKFRPDYKFEEYLSECNKRGIPYGVYAFSRGTTEEEINTETSSLCSYISERLTGPTRNGMDLSFKPSLPVYGDFFDDKDGLQKEIMDSGDYDTCMDIIETWCYNMEQAGYFTGVYINSSQYDNMTSNSAMKGKLEGYTLWIAQYSTMSPQDIATINNTTSIDLDGIIRIQQVTCNGYIDGIEGPVDVNVADRGIIKDVIRYYGFNGVNEVTSTRDDPPQKYTLTRN